MKTIYLFNNGGREGELHGVAMAEDGKALTIRVVEHAKYMQHDLGLTSDRSHGVYDAHYGVGGWKLEWVDEPREHDGLTEACRLNLIQAEAAANEPCDCPICSLKHTLSDALAERQERTVH